MQKWTGEGGVENWRNVWVTPNRCIEISVFGMRHIYKVCLSLLLLWFAIVATQGT